jgi:hypothetical protein
MEEMSATEMLYWRAYYELEPFGPPAEDWRLATVSSLLAETNRDRKRRPKPYTQHDFLLTDLEKKELDDGKTKATTPEGMLALARILSKSVGGKLKRKKRKKGKGRNGGNTGK